MADEPLILGGEFPEATRDDWRKAVEKALKGADFDRAMTTPTYEGFALEPLYTRDRHDTGDDPAGLPGRAPFTRGAAAAGRIVAGWDIRQRHADPDPTAANAAMLRDLERGVTSLEIVLDAAGAAGLDADAPEAEELAGRSGVTVYSLADLDRLLTGVHLDMAPIALRAGAAALPAAALLAALWAKQGVGPSDVTGAFNADPLGTLAATGRLPLSVDAALAQLADLAAHTAAELPGVTAVGVDTEPYYSAGASESQDLACALATGVAYLRALTGAGMSVDAACRQIAFTLPVGADQFTAIAKLRAARRLWARVGEVAGAAEPARAMRLDARTAGRMLSRRDPHVNMLRATLACFAAAVGGADSVTVLPYDAAVGLSGRFARRIARNTQLVLMEESSLARVIDPAGGSWFVEDMTRKLAQSAWAAFQEIERAGGMPPALADGTVAAMIERTSAERRRNLARRRDPLTGVSEFPNLDEAAPEPEPRDPAELAETARARLATARGAPPALLPAPGDGALTAALIAAAAEGASIGQMTRALAGEPATIAPLPAWGLDADYEALRAASDAHLARTGARPRIFLATIGRIVDFTARADFARNLFAAGGIETVAGDGGTDPAGLADAFRASGARAACLCASDALYTEHAAPIARALAQAGCEHLFLAGRPGEHRDAWAAAGIDEYVHVGSDAIEILTATLERLTRG